MPATLSTRFALIVVCCSFLGLNSHGQNTYQFGMMPSINLNKKFENGWGVNFKTESRQMFLEGAFGDDSNFDYWYDLTDFALIGSRKTGLDQRITGGYLLRVSEDQPVHRFIQQYIITQRLRSFRLSHRIATDQTLSFVETPEFRLRYRIATEVPLNGQSTDPKELYVKINNEYLGSLQLPDYYLELRIIPMLGYVATEKHKIELGIDYRNRAFLNTPDSRQSFWTRINWYISL